MLVDTERFNEIFPARQCPKCGGVVVPIASGTVSDIHGHEVRCPACRAFMGWGGKKKPIRSADHRHFGTQFSPQRLGIDTCQMCLRPRLFLGAGETLHSHHVVEVSDGGVDEPSNIWVVCTACHTQIHRQRTYLHDHMKPFFRAYEAHKRLKQAHPELFHG